MLECLDSIFCIHLECLVTVAVIRERENVSHIQGEGLNIDSRVGRVA